MYRFHRLRKGDQITQSCYITSHGQTFIDIHEYLNGVTTRDSTSWPRVMDLVIWS